MTQNVVLKDMVNFIYMIENNFRESSLIYMENDIENKAYVAFREGGFGEVLSLERVSEGYNNYIFIINNEYVIRLASEKDGRRFEKETAIIKSIQSNIKVPNTKLADFSKSVIDKDYTIAVKLEGSTLSKIWNELALKEKEQYIEQLAEELQKLHRYTNQDIPMLRESVNFASETIDENIKGFQAANEQGIVPAEVISYLEQYFNNHSHLYDQSSNFGLIHNDLHLHNVYVNKDDLVALMDFEYADLFPIDYELVKIVSEHDRGQVKEVSAYLKKYYPSLFESENLIDETIWGFKKARIDNDPIQNKAAEDFYDYVYLKNGLEKDLGM